MEVGPRDGLQIEPRIVSTADKIRLIDAIADAGIREIEVASFVNPKAVPQMADADELFAALKPREGLSYRALWLNPRGLERAIAAKNVDLEGRLQLTASETFVKRNTNRSIDQTFDDMPQWITQFKAAGVEPDKAAVMAAFGCNFEGAIPVSKVLELLKRLQGILQEHHSDLRHVALADTMGWANPRHIKDMLTAIRSNFPGIGIKLHLHDTRGTAMANALAALEEGVREFDASVGGLGGCPFAGHAGAAGNICTEDLAFLCEEMGIDTGIDLDALIDAAKLAEELVGHQVPGKLMKGGTRSRIRSRQAG
jgi:hydroxymethylglutaryl-CoA lyase